MPELSPAQRGSGPKLATGVTLRRRYRKADAGPPCDVCGLPMVKPLADAGETTHPTCGGAEADMLEASRKATAKARGQDPTL